MNPDTERALLDIYNELVQTCTNLRRAGSDPVISLDERNRLMATADGVNMAITHVVEMLRGSDAATVSSEAAEPVLTDRARR